MQRQLLDELLAKLPVHDAAHGFVPGRSTVTNAEPHVGAALVVKLDLLNFFPSIHYQRVAGLFRHYGYDEEVADLLAALTTHRPRLADGTVAWPGALPQGAPTSPALANLVCRRLDARLSGLARRSGARYTRYADDLTFSFEARSQRTSGAFCGGSTRSATRRASPSAPTSAACCGPATSSGSPGWWSTTASRCRAPRGVASAPSCTTAASTAWPPRPAGATTSPTTCAASRPMCRWSSPSLGAAWCVRWSSCSGGELTVASVLAIVSKAVFERDARGADGRWPGPGRPCRWTATSAPTRGWRRWARAARCSWSRCVRRRAALAGGGAARPDLSGRPLAGRAQHRAAHRHHGAAAADRAAKRQGHQAQAGPDGDVAADPARVERGRRGAAAAGCSSRRRPGR